LGSLLEELDFTGFEEFVVKLDVEVRRRQIIDLFRGMETMSAAAAT